MTRACEHEESSVEILSLTPALPGWGFAWLYKSGEADWRHHDELTIEPIAAWALVRHDDDCFCPRTMVLPLVAGRNRPQLEFPIDDTVSYACRLLSPGRRVEIVRTSNGESSIEVREGGWTAGSQDLTGYRK